MPKDNQEWVSAEAFILFDHEDEDFIEEEEPKKQAILGDWYPQWHAKAACLGEYEAADNFFYGQDERGIRPSLSAGQIKKAREFCAICPVLGECLETAIVSREKYGVWGGTTGRFRRQLFVMIDEGYMDIDGAILESIRRLVGIVEDHNYEKEFL